MGGIAGFASFTLISYILIVLNIPILIIPIVLLTIIFSTKPLIKTIKQIKTKPNFQTIIILIVFVLGIAGQMAVISPSGITQNGNLLFWSAHGHDGTWHIALMEEIKKGLPFENPIFAGEKLVNYHFFSDILPAMIGKYLFVSNFDLYFRIFPFIYSLFLGASAYFLTKRLTGSSQASIWATIFTYFAGSFGFIVTYIKGKTIGGESIFWATQPQSSSGNPPQIISDFLVLAAIYFLIVLTRQKNKSKNKIIFVVCVILFGTLASFKVYAGVVALGALGIAAIWQIVKEKRFQLLVLTAFSGALELRRQTYIYEHNWKRVIFLEGVGFLIFFFGNLGMRFVGLWNYLKTHLVIKVVVFLSILLPLIFLQKGVASNTSQFLQYFVLLFGILAGIQTSKITAKAKFLIPFIIILMLPTQIGLLREFYSRPAFAKVSSQEIEALNYIKENTPEDAVVVTPPYNQYLDLKDSTPNIWDWFDTSYVSAISARRTFFDDYEQADIMGYDWRPRLETKRVVFEGTNPVEVKNAFTETQANVLYFPKAVGPKVDPESLGLIRIFENQEIEVWKAN
ncbi:MAG: hypothetical protein UU02_C0055G0007 [Candidatus Woesebacteria bacterium GW2011_GWA1_40_43]|uniref:Glycosyltransferase RgtA/B/C/D-like domain-containing protein n=1 Tax=Candidatus Woesebacteria bacterium GW2011_GWA1_40_43 TaxID=1618553 RepID=A0A0G0VG37_9BACT|nr:MAG: hypothetical protein UU02_C0055G0007 [Candidatus Woesebacteria bacterium GW2011_GWA1_40_43]